MAIQTIQINDVWNNPLTIIGEGLLVHAEVLNNNGTIYISGNKIFLNTVMNSSVDATNMLNHINTLIQQTPAGQVTDLSNL